MLKLKGENLVVKPSEREPPSGAAGGKEQSSRDSERSSRGQRLSHEK